MVPLMVVVLGLYICVCGAETHDPWTPNPKSLRQAIRHAEHAPLGRARGESLDVLEEHGRLSQNYEPEDGFSKRHLPKPPKSVK